MSVSKHTHAQDGVTYEVMTVRENDKVEIALFATHIDGRPVNNKGVTVAIERTDADNRRSAVPE
jgi:hypothetical protein